MKSIFAVVCSVMSNQLRDSKFFSTKEAALKHLKSLANERKYKFGVDCFEEKEDGFSYLFGWGQKQISYYIVELSVEE